MYRDLKKGRVWNFELYFLRNKSRQLQGGHSFQVLEILLRKLIKEWTSLDVEFPEQD